LSINVTSASPSYAYQTVQLTNSQYRMNSITTLSSTGIARSLGVQPLLMFTSAYF